jgi:O-antigen/teichoic acid export membrane protein
MTHAKINRANWRPGALVQGAARVFGWNFLRLSAQFAWVVLLARVIGVEGYGAYSGAAGMAIALSGLVGFGLGLRMYQDVVREPHLFGTRWGQALHGLAWTSLALGSAYVLLSAATLDSISLIAILLISISELLAMPLVTHSAFAYAAHGQIARAAAAPVAMSLARLAAAALVPLATSTPSLDGYALLHAATTLPTAGWVVLLCRRRLAPPAGASAIDAPALREGLRLASIWASGLALNSLDKTFALDRGGAEAAGAYTAGNRFAQLMAAPVDALTSAAMPRLFHAGTGTHTNPRLIVWLFASCLVYGALAGAFAWIAAGTATRVFGPDFAAAAAVLSVLSLYIPAYCLRTLASSVLLGFGWTQWRVTCEILALGMIGGLMALWAPAGATGAAWALVASECALALALWTGYLARGALKRST